ncbi:LysR family transcriptional regulator [uncultured Psychromonas sp.]|uniref:LysR family transcriptional regulator n=1 Tax=uncultured Psychromonas sp. TaxID=173974 RepID=UPI0026136D5A|nr:LysR family transcriptional regulator [uncultured Psychromonas sp.]
MELKWIEDFLCLSQYGSFVKAAKSRCVTQPAFSRRIKALEEWVGVPLINRETYPSTFTKAGTCFLKHAANLKKEIEEARKGTQEVALNKLNTLTFHTQHALSEYVVNKMSTDNPDIFENLLIHVIADNLHNSAMNFLDKKSSYLVGLSFKTPRLELPSPNIQSAVIGAESLIPIVGIDNNGDAFYQDNAGDIVPLLSYPSDAFLAQVIETNNAMSQASCEFQTVYINSISNSLKSMALSGRGVAWLPLGLVKDEIKSGKLKIFSKKIKPIDAKIKIFSFPTEDPTPDKVMLWEKLTSIKL